MEFKVTNSPFSEEQAHLLNRLLPTLSNTQKVWLTGYLTALLENQQLSTSSVDNHVVESQPAKAVPKEITILYGSQTGNAQKLAENSAKTLEKEGFIVEVASMDDFKPNKLKKINRLLIFVSTYGEGTPPDNALSFHEFLHSKRAPKLDGLEYSVLALGDSSYEFFCQTGKEFDERLEQLGGKRIFDRVDCDLDFEESANQWLQGVIAKLNESTVTTASTVQSTNESLQQTVAKYSRNNPFYAEVLENINLNGKGSNKETRHIELSIEGSGLTYEAGDTLGIFPKNNPQLVNDVIHALKLNKDDQVQVDGEQVSLEEAFTSFIEITALTKPVLQKLVDYSTNQAFKQLVTENGVQLKEYMKNRDLLDLIQDYGPFNVTSKQIVSILRKMPPRLYSISSSYQANPDEVHLTIGVVRYDAHGRERKGVCSVYCAERLEVGDKVRIFIQPNPNFKLPKNSDAPIIMVGPGTGIAPFRGFMQEREEIGARGKSWLFFGDQHFVTDFLYQTEWQNWLKDGILTKMDVAFSRDKEEKIYVQHKLLQHSKELFSWIKEGAYIYVCGDKNKMAKDVQEALITIIAEEGNMSREDAENYLKDLQKQKRYQRDVY